MRRSFKTAAMAALLTAGCASTPGTGPSDLTSTLTGLQEVPRPGDPDATGTARFRLDPADGQLCGELNVRGADPASAAHIHRGAAGAGGPPVVTLITPDASGHSEGCVAVDPAQAREIALRPYDFYINVHNPAFPAGALRGQLRGRLVRQPARQPAGS